MKTAKMKIDGMHCSSCAELIKGTLEDSGMKASFSGDELQVAFDEKRTTVDSIKREVRKLGYGVA